MIWVSDQDAAEICYAYLEFHVLLEIMYGKPQKHGDRNVFGDFCFLYNAEGTSGILDKKDLRTEKGSAGNRNIDVASTGFKTHTGRRVRGAEEGVDAGRKLLKLLLLLFLRGVRRRALQLLRDFCLVRLCFRCQDGFASPGWQLLLVLFFLEFRKKSHGNLPFYFFSPAS